MARQIAEIKIDPISEMEWREPSTDDLDLESLPERLDDETLARVEAIAKSPLADLPPCDERTFGQALRMMLAVLPRRGSDDLSGELFVAAYERQLGHHPRPAIEYLCDKAIAQCRWFPTVAECHEILTMWRRSDEHTARRFKAEAIAGKEKRERSMAKWRAERQEVLEIRALTQADVDEMPEVLRNIGLRNGYLVQDEDGIVRPVD